MSRSAPALNTAPRVFLSFAAQDRGLAQEVSESLRHAGLDVTGLDELAPSGEYTDEVRRALQNSAAVVVVLASRAHRRDLSSGVLFEIGAAVGAGKRILVVTDDMVGSLPFGAPRLQVLPVARVDEIAKQLTAA